MSKNEKLKKDIAGLQELFQLVLSSKDILECDAKALQSRCHKFDEKEAIMLATEASLKAEVESLKEKLDSAVEDRSLMKKAMLVGRARAFEELVGMGLDFQLKDMKDYEPDAIDSFDKAVNNFYRVEFHYLDLLAYHARKSLGKRLPTRANLDYRGIDLDSVRFPMCDDAIETEEHIFVSCSIAKDTWKCIADSWNIPSITIANLLEGLNLADRVPLPAASIRFFNV
ncbi:RNA-directed DNA polymerase, eukaryota, reverse transcriptase zinc-binding domain protein, partial [Tanacetum coccineum]